jgi:hypothetical protein
LCWAYLAHAIWYTHWHTAVLLSHQSLACRCSLLSLLMLHYLLLLLQLLELGIRDYNLNSVRIWVIKFGHVQSGSQSHVHMERRTYKPSAPFAVDTFAPAVPAQDSGAATRAH